MKLLIEIGNTALKMAQWENGVLSGIKKIHYQTVEIAQVKEFINTSPVSEVLLASVANADFTRQIQNYWEQEVNIPLRRIKTQAQFRSVRNAYSDTQQLGVDRWLNLLAAFQAKPGAYMIVDAGTAVTLDWIDASGQHLGGLIVPGVQLQCKSLLENTEISTFSNSEITNLSLAQDTKNAVQRGAVYSIVACIDRLLTDTTNKYNTQFNGIITGGDAGIIHQYLINSFELSPSLTLFGLAAYAD